MAKHLAGNITRRVDFKTDVDHLQRRPVLVVDKVTNQFFGGLGIKLVGGIRDACAESNKICHIFDALRDKIRRRFAVGNQGDTHFN